MLQRTYIWLLLFIPYLGKADHYSIFKDAETLEIVHAGGMFIYNEQPQKADSVIAILTNRIPNHPVVPMMKALNEAWKDMPMTVESKNFKKHESYLKKCLSLAEDIHDDHPDSHDGIFFQIVSRGLLAEYYSSGGSFVKAVSEAQKIYGLIKKAESLVDKNPDFLFSVGLYNYYREYYEEHNPIMKPLLLFFRRGDKDLGLQQLEVATERAVLSKVEAHIYLSYIYLRYEKVPNKSIKLLENINEELPRNNFIRAKLAECLIKRGDHKKARKHYNQLIESSDPYYQLNGYVLKALNIEKMNEPASQGAKYFYQKGVEASIEVPAIKGKYMRSIAHLNLAKIYIEEGNIDEARPLLEKALETTDDPKIKRESKKLLQEVQ